jgi:integration host factor subunit beta
MIKSELIDKLASQLTHLPEQLISQSINEILILMTKALTEGRRIEIRGFGSFSLHQRGPRHAHNPKTGEKITTKSKRTAHFKPGKELRQRVDFSRLNYPIEVLHEHD